MNTYTDVIYNSLENNKEVNETAVVTMKEAGISTVIVKKSYDSIELLYPTPQDEQYHFPWRFSPLNILQCSQTPIYTSGLY